MPEKQVLTLLDLPDEILLHIFAPLRVQDWVALSKTCKALLTVIRVKGDKPLWKQLFPDQKLANYFDAARGVYTNDVSLKDMISKIDAAALTDVGVDESFMDSVPALFRDNCFIGDRVANYASNLYNHLSQRLQRSSIMKKAHPWFWWNGLPLAEQTTDQLLEVLRYVVDADTERQEIEKKLTKLTEAKAHYGYSTREIDVRSLVEGHMESKDVILGLALAKCQECWTMIIPEKYKKDRAFMLEIVTKDPRVLQETGFKSDRNFVQSATLATQGAALQYAGYEIRGDKDMVENLKPHLDVNGQALVEHVYQQRGPQVWDID